MAKIVVFDSGLGSLSVILQIRQKFKCNLVYFADEKNFPYGTKTKKALKKIIQDSINKLEERLKPDFIVIGSNTPTILFPELLNNKILGILPPIRKATTISKTKSIAVLTTKSVHNSRQLKELIQKNSSANTEVIAVNCSPLIELVEGGQFATDKALCRKRIHKTLGVLFDKKSIDVATLSSTHLPFLRELLEEEFPAVSFLDPAVKFASDLSKRIRSDNQNRLTILTSGNPKLFEQKLELVGIYKRVLTFSP